MVASERAHTTSSRRRFLTGLGVAGGMGLAGCSTRNALVGDIASGSGTTVEFWTLFSGGDGATMQSIVSRFNDEQPLGNVQIDRQRIPWNDYYTKVYTALVADKGPDIAIMHQALISRFRQMLTPYNRYIDDSTASQYVPTLWKRMRFDGNQLALPLDAHPIGAYYNRSVFEEAGLDPDSPPTNFREFKNVCDTIVTETDANAFAPSAAMSPIELLRTFIAFDRQRGGQLFNDDLTEVRFNNPNGLRIAQLYHNSTGKYGWDLPNASASRTDVAFQDGNLGIIVNGTWYAAVLQTLDGMDWNMFKPFVAPGKQQNWTESGSHTIVLPRKQSRDREQTQTAVRVAEWLTQENPIWGTQAGHLPAASKLQNSPALRESPLWSKSLSKFSEMASEDQFAYLPRTPFNVNEASTWDFLLDIYSHSTSPKAGLERGAETVQGLIDDVN
ncbi:extracellular solute-binding protein [Halococcus hamelinensis]|nr:extracellular solute-binding protein [Halococcus hamelinensis]